MSSNKKELSIDEKIERAVKVRKDWDDDRVKKDWKMWREITGSGRVLTEDQQARYEATRKEIRRRRLIPLETQK